MSDVECQGLRYRFSGFELEPCERRLMGHGEPMALTFLNGASPNRDTAAAMRPVNTAGMAG